MAKKTAAAAADLLIEIGCEDLPARFVVPLANSLLRAAVDALVHWPTMMAGPRLPTA
jgi:glycyl-tRNA synthetase beta subunit